MRKTADDVPQEVASQKVGEWDNLAAAIATERLKAAPVVSSMEEADETDLHANGKIRKRVTTRNVGGWISPQFAKVLDRSWLNVDQYEENFDLRAYRPQAGDVVL